MKYKITITKIETETVTEEGQWTVVDKRPWTEEEIGEKRLYGQSTADFLKQNPLKEVRGYAPAVTRQRQNEIEVLKQTVEELDLASVIKAINRL